MMFVLALLHQWHCLNAEMETAHPGFMPDNTDIRSGPKLPKSHSSWLVAVHQQNYEEQ